MIWHEAHRVEGQRIYRFVLAERIAHWLNASAFFLLAATGAAMLLRHSLHLSPRPIHRLRDFHLAAGLLYFFGPAAVLLIGNPRVGWRWAIEALRWSRHDFLWLLGPLQRFFLPRGARLRVGRFNAGQRMNMALQIGGKWGLFATGLAMHLSHGVIILYALHLLFCFFLLLILAGHLYLAMFNAATRPSLSAMLSGYVVAEWLEHHHLEWFEELVFKHHEAEKLKAPCPAPAMELKIEDPPPSGAGAPPEGPE